MIRRNNRTVFSSVSRNVRRAQAAIVRANRSNVKWMKRYTQRQAERQNRLDRFTAAIRKAFSFVPMVRSGLSAIWASMASVFVSMYVTPPTRPIRVAVNRSGMLGTNKKRGRGKRRRNARSKAKSESGNTYETLEDRKLLAVSNLMIGLSGTELTITDVAGIDNNLTVQVSGATTTITATGGGGFDAIPSGLTSGTLNTDSTALTFNTADVSSVVVDSAGGDDTLCLLYTSPSPRD